MIGRAARDSEICRRFGLSKPSEYLAHYQNASRDGTGAALAIRDVGGECFGLVTIELHASGRAEVGYWLLPEGRGRGRATRALQLVSRWALTQPGVTRLELSTSPDNVASQRWPSAAALSVRASFGRSRVLRRRRWLGCRRVRHVVSRDVKATTLRSRNERGLLTRHLHHPETADAAPPPGGAAAGLSFRQLLRLMREDWRTHRQQPSRPGLQAVWVQRFGAWRYGLPVAARKPASLLYRVLHVFVRNVYGIEVFDATRLGRRVLIAHQGGIVIDWEAEIGDGSVIHHNVTIAPAEHRIGGAPRLGRNVFVGAGTIIVGAITIGDGARIGPNVVVTRNVPPEALLFAPAPRTIETPRRADG